jgi:hypothetical protein
MSSLLSSYIVIIILRTIRENDKSLVPDWPCIIDVFVYFFLNHGEYTVLYNEVKGLERLPPRSCFLVLIFADCFAFFARKIFILHNLSVHRNF